MNDIAGIGHNQTGPVTLQIRELKEKHGDLETTRNELLAGVDNVPDDLTLEDARDLSDFIKQIGDNAKAAENLRENTKAGPLEICKAIDNYFKTITDPLEAVNRKLKTKLCAYMRTGDDEQIRGDRGSVASLTARTSFTIIDEKKIPRRFLSPDKAKINAARKAGTYIPGIEDDTTYGVTVR